MGWADCGKDSKGRNIGYAWAAKCDHKGCKAEIDRGLAYACGDMHGTEGDGCEKYFCNAHMVSRYSPTEQRHVQLCEECAASLDAIQMEEFEGLLKRIIPLCEQMGEFLVDEPKDAELYAMALAAWLADLNSQPGGYAELDDKPDVKKMVVEAYDLLTNWDLASENDNLPLDGRYMTDSEIKRCTDAWVRRQEHRAYREAHAHP